MWVYNFRPLFLLARNDVDNAIPRYNALPRSSLCCRQGFNTFVEGLLYCPQAIAPLSSIIMEAEENAYRDRFADIRANLTGGVDRGFRLIEDLLDKLERTESSLKQAKFDLENECDARRRLQEEAQQHRDWRERQSRSPFVVALIDADADEYIFRDDFIKKGEDGGKIAADSLLAALQSHINQLYGGFIHMDFVVRAFANVSGLEMALKRDSRLQNCSQLRDFVTGFNNGGSLFDFVDVGPGKERADTKIRGEIHLFPFSDWPVGARCSIENMRFFLDSSQCQHIVVACGYDTGYAPFLGQLVGDKKIANRITLLEGPPFPLAIRKLGLKTTRFSSVFQEEPHLAHGQGSIVSDVNTISAVRPPFASFSGWRNPKAQFWRLAPVVRNEAGRRVDKALLVDDATVERIQAKNLCFFLFLRGECKINGFHRNHHHQELTDNEFDALWYVARKGRCKKSQKADAGGVDCSDERCVYGHGNATMLDRCE
ncbi:ccch zinc finger protein [Colletotrichum incanum]|uniref:Ccch zinc finger protein n=1 Tax=Colletotrichum incanum TaxID=1573173 RepID=A0A161WB16_COLIC|nr:ccch zinc finger protein [Colletotrichum incanum]